MRKDRYGKRNRVVAEGHASHVVCYTVLSKTARLRVVQNSSRVVCVIVASEVSVGGSRFVDLRFCSVAIQASSGTELFVLDDQSVRDLGGVSRV